MKFLANRNSKEWCSSKLAEDTYLIHSRKSSVHLFLLKGTENALLIDTGCGGKRLREYVESLIDTPVMVVNTHGHYDHIGSNGEFDRVYIHSEDRVSLHDHENSVYVNKIVAQINPKFMVWYYHITRPAMFHPKICSQMVDIEDGVSFDLGNRLLKVIHIPGHSKGSICLYEEDRKSLFIGDSVCEKMVLLGMDHGSPVHVYKESLEKLAKMLPEDSLLFPNHHALPIDMTLLQEYITCAQQIIEHPESYKIQKFAGNQVIYQEYKRARLTYDVHAI